MHPSPLGDLVFRDMYQSEALPLIPNSVADTPRPHAATPGTPTRASGLLRICGTTPFQNNKLQHTSPKGQEKQ